MGFVGRVTPGLVPLLPGDFGMSEGGVLQMVGWFCQRCWPFAWLGSVKCLAGRQVCL